ncbi:MAG: diguanylate cyclase, partial [Rhizobacter sp.]|nr:diguanylate cyclase [Rhizobacter sp.]
MQFDFQAFEALTTAGAVMGDARILELQAQLAARTAKLDLLIDNGAMMSVERDRNQLLHHIILQCQHLLNCDGGTLYLVMPDGTEEGSSDLGADRGPHPVERRQNEKALRFAMRTRSDDLPSTTIPLHDPATGEPNEHHVSTWVALHNRTVRIDDVYADQRFDLSGTRRFDEQSHYRTVSMLTVPMAPRGGDVIGVLQFINAMDPVNGRIVPFADDLVRLVEALAAQAAVALDNLNLVQAQKALIESMIRVLATAIDAKSHYTGRHCERVPELAMMLAEAACDSKDGPLAAFGFRNEDEWQEFRIGAWLHDCGKVTTPEYVIDKATKLETIYNRIHEVRMRFEVLLRDAEIERLQARLAGADEGAAAAAFERRRAGLMADFAFVADCNVGGETMDAAHRARLASIAEQRWTRHFDDRLGLSAEETVRAAVEPPMALPAVEPLL